MHNFAYEPDSSFHISGITILTWDNSMSAKKLLRKMDFELNSIPKASSFGEDCQRLYKKTTGHYPYRLLEMEDKNPVQQAVAFVRQREYICATFLTRGISTLNRQVEGYICSFSIL